MNRATELGNAVSNVGLDGPFGGTLPGVVRLGVVWRWRRQFLDNTLGMPARLLSTALLSTMVT